MFEKLLKNGCFSFHLIIVQCDPSDTCSGNGTCEEDGSCKCSDGFYGDSCSSISINISSVIEFQRWWVLKSKFFAEKSTYLLKGNSDNNYFEPLMIFSR